MQEILFLAHRIPWPADRGDKIRSHHILRQLAGMAPVHVGAFADDDRDLGFVAEMAPHFQSLHIEMRHKPQWRAGLEAVMSGQSVSVKSFASPSMSTWVDALIATGRIGHIFVFSGQMAQYVPLGFDGRFVMDFVDVDSAKFEDYARSGNPVMRWINAREGRLLSSFEQDSARRADASLFVSEAEAALFLSRSAVDGARISAVGNGIDSFTYDPGRDIPWARNVPSGKLILFTGQMDYRPNVQAVCDFATHAMPAIRAEHQDAQFVIVGRNPAPAVRALAGQSGVHVTGAVPDIRSWLRVASVVVAPLRIARGIQNKVLEAMAMECAVVASHAAAAGIDAQDGQHFHIARDVGHEAQLVTQILDNPAQARLMGRAARKHVISHYNWANQLKPLHAIMALSQPIAMAAQ